MLACVDGKILPSLSEMNYFLEPTPFLSTPNLEEDSMEVKAPLHTSMLDLLTKLAKLPTKHVPISSQMSSVDSPVF